MPGRAPPQRPGRGVTVTEALVKIIRWRAVMSVAAGNATVKPSTCYAQGLGKTRQHRRLEMVDSGRIRDGGTARHPLLVRERDGTASVVNDRGFQNIIDAASRHFKNPYLKMKTEAELAA